LRSFLFYTILIFAALGALIAWRKWAVDIQETVSSPQNSGPRIISVSPNITEILYALGLENSIVGVTDFCNYPAQVKEKQSIGTIMDPDLEMILSLEPTDVFVTNTDFHLALGRRLSEMGLNVHILDVDRMEGVNASILAIGEVAGCVEKSMELNQRIKAGLAEVRAKAAKFEHKPRVLIVIQPEPIIAAGKRTYIDEILSLAGGENVITDTGHLYPMINAETLIELDPEIIIETVVGAVPERSERALAHYKWNIRAVTDKNVFVIEADKLSRPGPRVVEAARQMQQIITATQQEIGQ
jgi:iron complex transport system substrate-binding protein